MIYIAITKDRLGRPRAKQTYHLQVRLAAAGAPVLQSRVLASPSNAQREAERIFGPLKWMSREQAGLDQTYVVQIAEYKTAHATISA